jgi:hypothetical protein
VLLDGRQAAVAGVLPSDFAFELPSTWGVKLSPREVDGYVPLLLTPETRVRGTGFGGSFGNVVARLSTGVSSDQARVEVETMRHQIAAENPGWRPNQASLLLLPTLERLAAR